MRISDFVDFKVNESASAGATGAASVATVVGGLGAGFNPNGDYGIYSKPSNKKKPIVIKRINENENAEDIPVGTLVSAKIGDEYDERTCFFVRENSGWRKVDCVNPKDYKLSLENIGRANLSRYHNINVIAKAPKAGEKPFSPVQFAGFPDGTEILTPNGTIVHVHGDDIVYPNGERVNLNFAEYCRLR